MENKGSKKSVDPLKVGIEETSIEKQKSLGVFDAEKYESFETSVAYDLDKFEKFEKFGFYSEERIERILESGKPLSDLDKLALSNLLYEYKYFRAYFETVQESVRLFGDEKGTLRNLLGSSLLYLKKYLWLWRDRGEKMNMKLSDFGLPATEEDIALWSKIDALLGNRDRRFSKSMRRANGKDINGILNDYFSFIGGLSAYYENTVSPQTKLDALELIKNKYQFSSVDAVKKCLQREDVENLPRL